MDRKFVERSEVIKKTDPVEMLKHLGVNKKYIISDNFKFSNGLHDYDPNSKKKVNDTIDSVASESDESDLSTPKPENSKAKEYEQIPYQESIKALERISSYTSPRDKLD